MLEALPDTYVFFATNKNTAIHPRIDYSIAGTEPAGNEPSVAPGADPSGEAFPRQK